MNEQVKEKRQTCILTRIIYVFAFELLHWEYKKSLNMPFQKSYL